MRCPVDAEIRQVRVNHQVARHHKPAARVDEARRLFDKLPTLGISQHLVFLTQ